MLVSYRDRSSVIPTDKQNISTESLSLTDGISAISCVEYGGVLDYTIVHTYPTDKGTEKTEKRKKTSALERGNT